MILTEYLATTHPCSKHFAYVLILLTTGWGGYYHCSRFLVGETEAQRGWVISLRSYSFSVAEPKFEPKLFDSLVSGHNHAAITSMVPSPPPPSFCQIIEILSVYINPPNPTLCHVSSGQCIQLLAVSGGRNPVPLADFIKIYNVQTLWPNHSLLLLWRNTRGTKGCPRGASTGCSRQPCS